MTAAAKAAALAMLSPAVRKQLKLAEAMRARAPAVQEARPVQADILSHPLAFAREYLSHHAAAATPAFHEEMTQVAVRSSRCVFAAPRGHAKSTCMSLIYPLWAAATGRKKYIVIVSDTSTQARDHLGNIISELMENERLVKDFPHLELPEMKDRGKKRTKNTQDDIITRGGVSFSAKGSGVSMRGMRRGSQRPDLIIVDDLENDEHVATEAQRLKLRDWFNKSLANLFGAGGGQIVVVGTVLHRSGLLNWLLNRIPDDEGPSNYERRLYRAIDEKGPLWPEYWTAEKLEVKKREIGSKAFASEFLNDPAENDNTLFKREWLDASRVTHAPPLERVLIGLDPSTTATGDACGIVAVGVDGRQNLYVLADATTQASPAVWGRRALDLALQTGATGIVAESNQGGEMIRQVLESVKRQDERAVPVLMRAASKSKAARAEPIAARAEAGELHIVGNMPLLESEITDWAPGMASPNRLDALVWACAELLNAGAAPSKRRAVKRSGFYFDGNI